MSAVRRSGVEPRVPSVCIPIDTQYSLHLASQSISIHICNGTHTAFEFGRGFSHDIAYSFGLFIFKPPSPLEDGQRRGQ